MQEGHHIEKRKRQMSITRLINVSQDRRGMRAHVAVQDPIKADNWKLPGLSPSNRVCVLVKFVLGGQEVRSLAVDPRRNDTCKEGEGRMSSEKP